MLMPNMPKDTSKTLSEQSILGPTSTHPLDNSAVRNAQLIFGWERLIADARQNRQYKGSSLDTGESPVPDTETMGSIRYRIQIETTWKDGSANMAAGRWHQVASWTEERRSGGSVTVRYRAPAMDVDIE